jgi:hypothetical protein
MTLRTDETYIIVNSLFLCHRSLSWQTANRFLVEIVPRTVLWCPLPSRNLFFDILYSRVVSTRNGLARTLPGSARLRYRYAPSPLHLPLKGSPPEKLVPFGESCPLRGNTRFFEELTCPLRANPDVFQQNVGAKALALRLSDPGRRRKKSVRQVGRVKSSRHAPPCRLLKLRTAHGVCLQRLGIS